TAGLAIVVVVSLLARLKPSWFSTPPTGRFLPGIHIERRLAYPMNYSTGLAAMIGMLLPLLLAATSAARSLLAQALAAAALPPAVVALWLTGSALSVPVALVGI